jgi:signal transduction histidine kinase
VATAALTLADPVRRGVRDQLREKGWLLFLVWMAFLTGAYFLVLLVRPHGLAAGPVFNLVGLSAVFALIVGAKSRPAGARLPWYLFALGQFLFVVGDVLAYNYKDFFGSSLPYPSVADGFYLGFYPLLIGGLLLLIQQRRASRDRGSLIDAMMITAAVGALSWTYLMSPYARDASLGLPTKLVSIAYPLMDLLVLGVLVRLVTASGRRALGFVLLVLGFGTLLVTDAVYGWMLLKSSYSPGGGLEVGWAAFYALLGAAALHPSTRTLFERTTVSTGRLTGRRVALLAAASMTAPVLMLTRGLSSTALDTRVLAVASAAMFALVLVRMTGLMHSREDAVRGEAERTAELAAAERSAKAKDDFVSQVSHELRTPLTSICGYVSILQGDEADALDADEKRGYLAVIDRNSDRLLRLVEDLLFVSEIDDGKFLLQEDELDLAEVAAEAVEAARPAAESKQIRLRLEGPEGLRLRGDRGRLAQVIDNLLSNAIKFSAEGGEVTVDLARSNGTAKLVVADNGAGVRSDEVGLLFERFYRTEAAMTGAIQGTGLGLSISKAIVEAHRGRITASSRLGVGTSLAVELPAA